METVSVLMSTYNGEKYLAEQIESILNQKGVIVKLLVRDDGSRDGTLNILREYEKKGKLEIISGKNIGYKRSFLSLLECAEDSNYYAFADQDDIWHEDKLLAAVKMLKKEDQGLPLLYTSALTCVNENLEYLRTQKFFGLKLNFYSEFVRHRFAGCTYVFNKNLRETCKGRSYCKHWNIAHDEWVCFICWLGGGTVVFDQKSHILFRRHNANSSIDGKGLLDRVKYELAFIHKRKDYKFNMIKIILDNNFRVKKEFAYFFDEVIHYKDSLRQTFQLAFDKRLDCGVGLLNMLFRVSILLRCM